VLGDFQTLTGKGPKQPDLGMYGAQLYQEIGLKTFQAYTILWFWMKDALRGVGFCSSSHAWRFEAWFGRQALSWGHSNPKIQFLLFSPKQRVSCGIEVVTFISWKFSSTAVLRAPLCC